VNLIPKKCIHVALALLGLSFSHALDCGSCPGCTLILPGIESSASTILDSYKTLEDRVAKRYEKEILPLEKEILLLEHEIMRETAHIQALERKILLYQKGIVYITESIKELELTRTQTQPNKTNQKKE